MAMAQSSGSSNVNETNSNSSTAKVHITVLETDTPVPGEAKEDSYAKVFEELFKRVGSQMSPKIKVDIASHYVVDGDLPSSDILDHTDALIISGSKFEPDSHDPWVENLVSFLKGVYNRYPRIKLSGVCFGHQILARALGGTLESGQDWELALTEIKLTPDGKKLFALEGERDVIKLHQMHSDKVLTVPEGARVWGTSEHSEIQGMYIPGRLFTTQGHVGFDRNMVEKNLDARVAKELLSEEEAGDARARAHLEHDGELVARAILRFIRFE